jgi:hypothetical protein
MKYVDLGVGPGWVVSTRSDAAQLWCWLQERRNQVLGLDLETNGIGPWTPESRQRLCQFSDGQESWIIRSEQPGMLDVVRTCVAAHDYWLAHFAEADIRFAERGAPGSIRLDQITPHVADLQPVLAYYDPRTVTTAAKKDRIDIRIRRSKGLKETALRLLPEGKLLVDAKAALHARFAEIIKTAGPSPEALAAIEAAQPIIDHYGLTTSGVRARAVLSSLGVSSPHKTPKGNDSWDLASLQEIQPTLSGTAADVVDALLALRALHARNPESGWALIGDDDEIYWRYAGLDPLMTLRLWQLMTKEIKARGQWPAVRQAIKLQWHIDCMTYRGKLVDPAYAKWLDAFYVDIIEEHATALASHGIPRSAGGPSVGKAFTKLGLSSPKTTVNGGESWDKYVLADIADGTIPASPAAIELATTVRSVRGATKFRAAYVAPMLECLTQDQHIHCSMRAIGTITGRQSAARPALQQLPKRSSKRIRPAFVAPPGWVYVTCDLAQGEPRMMAARSGDQALIRDLLAGDFYGSLATLAFGNAYNPDERKIADSPSYHMRDGSKIGFILRCYGGGNDKLAHALGRDMAFAKETRARWDDEYHVLAEYERQLNWQPHIVLDSGRICPLWDRYYVTEDDQVLLRSSEPSRLGLNYDTQGSLADYLNNAMEKVIDAGWSWALRMPFHDEMVGCAPENKAQDFADILTDAMTSVYRGVPMQGDATIEGRAWMPQENTGFHPAELVDIDE